MTAREELARFIDSFNGDEAGDIDQVLALDGNTGYAMRGGNDVLSVLNKARDALLAEGWRKMPSRKAVEQALANSWDDATEYEGAVDAILALMDGSRR